MGNKKNEDCLNRRRELILNRVSNSKNPPNEIRRLASELFLDTSTIYRDLESTGYDLEAVRRKKDRFDD
jgi:hypothetical protein